MGDALRQVVHERALVTDVMTAGDVERIREEMERAEARKLQPHFIRSFFLEAFTHLGGDIREREPGRFEITNVPAELRRRDRQIGLGAPLLRRYERVTFDKDLIAAERRPLAEYLAPGHPLLDVTIDLIIERYDSLLRQGAVLVDEHDPGEVPHVLVYLQHAVVDGRADQAGNRRVVSKRFEFVKSILRDRLVPPAGRPTWTSARRPPMSSGADARDRGRLGPRRPRRCRGRPSASRSPGRTWRRCAAGPSTGSSGGPVRSKPAGVGDPALGSSR